MNDANAHLCNFIVREIDRGQDRAAEFADVPGMGRYFNGQIEAYRMVLAAIAGAEGLPSVDAVIRIVRAARLAEVVERAAMVAARDDRPTAATQPGTIAAPGALELRAMDGDR